MTEDGAVEVGAGFEIHGHRGARGLHPENTIEGFIAALEAGADVLETDLLMTRDGVVVVHHDFEPNPNTTRDRSGEWVAEGAGPIVTLTRDDLRAFDVGRLRPGTAYAAQFPHQRGADGYRIPTLREAVDALEVASGGRVRWNLEIKIATLAPSRTAAPEAVADATVAIVRERGLVTRTMIQSFDWRVVRRVQAIAPEIPTGCLTDPDTVRRRDGAISPFTAGLDLDELEGSVAALVHAAGARYWTPAFRMIGRSDVEEAHRRGLRVVPWTVNDPEDLATVVALGVDGVITDYPDRLARRGGLAR